MNKQLTPWEFLLILAAAYLMGLGVIYFIRGAGV